MKIFVQAKPNSREEKIEKIDPPSHKALDGQGDYYFVVSVKEPPIQGRANAAIIKALAEYFNVAPSRVRLISGFSSRQKVFEIL